METNPVYDSYEDLITILIGAMGQRALFYREHPRVVGATAEFVRGLEARMKADQKQVFFLGIVDGRLVHDGRLLFGSTILGRKLLIFAERLKCGGFLFREPIRAEDVQGLLDLYAELRGPVANLQEARERLKRVTEAIQISPPYEDPDWFGQFVYARTESWGGATETSGADGMTGVFQSLFDTVETAHERAATQSSIDVNGARSVAEDLLKSAGGRLHDVMRLVRYPNYDSYTVGHSVRVALLGVQVGLTLKLENRFLLELATAGLLHDVGKAKIPNEILFKAGRLDAEERQIMSHHPRLGSELLMEQENVSALSLAAAFGHHIRHDRGGYPAIPKWHAVGKATALIHVCDVFEALTAIRPYKVALSPRRAFEIMLSENGSFHPGAFAALVRSVGLYPPGSRVLLSSGEQAMVIAAGDDIARPLVSVTQDSTGAALPREKVVNFDLSGVDHQELSIARLLDDSPRPSQIHQDAVKHAC